MTTISGTLFELDFEMLFIYFSDLYYIWGLDEFSQVCKTTTGEEIVRMNLWQACAKFLLPMADPLKLDEHARSGLIYLRNN